MKFSKLYTGGTFDLFHFGHQNFLRQCRNLSNHVVVALNTDNFVKRFKNKKPILNFNERKKSLLFSPFVDEVVKNEDGEDSTKCILNVRPEIIAVGDDWLLKDYHKQMGFTQQWLEDNSIELIYLPYSKEISSSEIKNRIINNG